MLRAVLLASLVRAAVSLALRPLGRSDLRVSEACLGSMTWGVQNSEAEAFAQMDLARDRGVNFIDTAEMYPVPVWAEAWRAGATEEIIGAYLRARPGAREELVVATKISGYAPRSPVAAARTTPPTDPPPDCRLDGASVRSAVDASLTRLGADRVDLLQIHWPDRPLPLWGATRFVADGRDAVPIEETAAALRDLVDDGKVRAFGLSNESPYGVGEWARACRDLGVADRLATIQNSYSLLDRRFEGDLAESCDRYGVDLLPWSVLAGGLLSGKYAGGAAPPRARFTDHPRYMKRWSPATASPETLRAVDDYAAIAADAGLTPAALAIAFARSRPFVPSTIIGATSLGQLAENLDAFAASIDDDVLAAVDAVHLRARDPCCSL